MNNERKIFQQISEKYPNTGSDFEEMTKISLCDAIKVTPQLDCVNQAYFGAKSLRKKTECFDDNSIVDMLVMIDIVLSETDFSNCENTWQYLNRETLVRGFKAYAFFENIYTQSLVNIESMAQRLFCYLFARLHDEIEIKERDLVEQCIMYVKEHDNIYVLLCDNTNRVIHTEYNGGCITINYNPDKDVPYIDEEGYLLVFTDKEYAEKVAREKIEMRLSVCQLSQDVFRDSIRSWIEYGITKMIVNKKIDIDDHEAIIEAHEYLGEAYIEYEGMSFNNVLSRTIQLLKIPGKDKEKNDTYNLFFYLMKYTLFLVPIQTNTNLKELEKDNTLYMSQKTFVLLNEIYNNRKNSTTQTRKEFFASVLFLGAEKYLPLNPDNQDSLISDEELIFRTCGRRGAEDEAYFPLYTNIELLHSNFSSNVRVCVVTLSDVHAQNDYILVDTVKDTKTPIKGVLVCRRDKQELFVDKDFVMEIVNSQKKSADSSASEVENKERREIECRQELIENYKNTLPRNTYRKNKLCRASRIIGILAFLLDITPVMGTVAVFLGIIGLRKTEKANRDEVRCAYVGIITGAIKIVVGIMFVSGFIF